MSAQNSNAFHDHLDICARCKYNPMNLCPEGSRLLKQAVNAIEADFSRFVPPER